MPIKSDIKTLNYLCINKTIDTMDLEAELKWIRKELDQVKDENLLAAIKNILKYRKKVVDLKQKISLSEEQYQIIDKRRNLHLEGKNKSFSREQAKQNVRNTAK